MRYKTWTCAFLTVALPIALLCLNLSHAAKPRVAPPKYSVLELGPMSTAIDISNRDAAGRCWVAGRGVEGNYVAAMAAQVSSTGVTLMKYLPEPDRDVVLPSGDTFNGASDASDVNDAGDIVGGADVYDPNLADHEFRISQPAFWLNNGNGQFTYQHLPLLAGDNHGEASGINNFLYSVGYSGVFIPSSGLVTQSATLWDPVLGVIDLNDLLPAGSPWFLERAWDINDSNLICGQGELAGVLRAFVMDAGSGTIVAVPLLPQGIQNTAWQINQQGHVVGWSQTGQLDAGGRRIQHAYLWKGVVGQGALDLGSLTSRDSYANDVNGQGAVVGSSVVDVEDSLATRWASGSTTPIKLDAEVPTSPAWHINYASGLNEQGWIGGQGRKTYRGTVSWSGVILVPTGQ